MRSILVAKYILLVIGYAEDLVPDLILRILIIQHQLRGKERMYQQEMILIFFLMMMRLLQSSGSMSRVLLAGISSQNQSSMIQATIMERCPKRDILTLFWNLKLVLRTLLPATGYWKKIGILAMAVGVQSPLALRKGRTGQQPR